MENTVIREGAILSFQSDKEKQYISAFPASFSKTDVSATGAAHPHAATFRVIIEKLTFSGQLQENQEIVNEDEIGSRRDIPLSPRDIVFGQQIKLQHVASGLYLSVSERDSLSLVQEYEGQNGLFKMLQDPNDHVRDSKQVYFNDKILLQSCGQMNNYIRCFSTNVEDETNKGDKYLFKLSSAPVSVFNVKCYINTHHVSNTSGSTEKFPHPRAIRGGNIIQLRNQQIHAYIACSTHNDLRHLTPKNTRRFLTVTFEGKKIGTKDTVNNNREGDDSSSSEDEDYDSSSDNWRTATLGARQKWVHYDGIRRPPPVSGDSWWQLEIIERNGKELEELGSPVEFGDVCCLRHVPTQQYVKFGSAVAQFIVQSAKNPKLSSGVILKGSVIRLKLNVLPANNVPMTGHPPIRVLGFLKVQANKYRWMTKKKVGSRWYNTILSQEEVDPFNSFVIEEVKPEYIYMMYYFIGIKKILTVDEKRKDWLSVLEDLKQYLERNKFRAKVCMKMLRNYEVTDRLVELLRLDDTNTEVQKWILEILICLAKVPSHKSLTHLGSDMNLKVFFDKIGQDAYIEDLIEKLLERLIKNERTIGKPAIEKFKDKVTTELLQQPSCLDLLSSFCLPGGHHSKPAQDLVYHDIIEPHWNNFVIATKLVQDQNQDLKIVCLKETDFGSDIPMRGVFSKGTRDDDLEQQRFVAQMKLFANVCKGVNKDLIMKMESLITYEECYYALKDDDIHPIVRSVYLEFLLSVHIDKKVFDESGIEIDGIWNCYLKRKLLEEQDELKVANIKSDLNLGCNHDLKKLLENKIFEHDLNINKEKAGSSIVNNNHYVYKLLAKILAAYEPMVAYGFCWNIQNWQLMNFVKILREDETELDEVKSYQEVRVRSIKILHCFFKQLCVLGITRVLRTFTRNHSKSDSLFAENFSAAACDGESISNFANEVKHFFDFKSYACFNVNHVNGRVLVSALKRMLLIDNDELKMCSAKLLFDMYRIEQIIFDGAHDAYIFVRNVDPGTHTMYDDMIFEGSFRKDQKEMAQSSLKSLLLGNDKEYFPKTRKELFDKIKFLQKYMWFTDDDGFNIKVDEDDSQYTDVVRNTSAQHVALTTGVFRALIKYILKFSDIDFRDVIQTDEQEVEKKLFRVSCNTLCDMTCSNKKVKRRVFEHFGDILKLNIAVSSVANLLTQTLTNNVHLCHELDELSMRNLYTIARSRRITKIDMTTMIDIATMIPESQGHKVHEGKYYDIVVKCVAHLDDPTRLYTKSDTFKMIDKEWIDAIIQQVGDFEAECHNEKELQQKIIASILENEHSLTLIETKLFDSIMNQLNKLKVSQDMDMEKILTRGQETLLETKFIPLHCRLVVFTMILEQYNSLTKDSFSNFEKQPRVSYFDMIRPIFSAIRGLTPQECDVIAGKYEIQLANVCAIFETLELPYPKKAKKNEVTGNEDGVVLHNLTEEMLLYLMIALPSPGNSNSEYVKEVKTFMNEVFLKILKITDYVQKQKNLKTTRDSCILSLKAQKYKNVLFSITQNNRWKYFRRKNYNVQYEALTYCAFAAGLASVLKQMEVCKHKCHELSEQEVINLYLLATTEHTDYYTVLETVMMPILYPDDSTSCVLLKKKQECVIKLFKENRPNSLKGDKTIILFRKLLKQLHNFVKEGPNTKALSREALQFFSVSNMLSYCCKGDCDVAETECRKIFSLDQLLSIIEDEGIGSVLKVPFVNLLIELYIDTEQETSEVLKILVSEDHISFWTIIEGCTPSDQSFLKKLLRRHKYMLRRIFSGHINCRHMLELTSDEWSSKLFFTVKAIVPLIGALRKATSSLIMTQTTVTVDFISLSQRIYRVYEKVKSLLLELPQMPQITLTLSVQTKFWMSFLEDVQQLVPDLSTIVTDNQVALGNKEGYKLSAALENYEKEFFDEKEMNKTLEIYISNYEAVMEQVHIEDASNPKTSVGIRRFSSLAKSFIESDESILEDIQNDSALTPIKDESLANLFKLLYIIDIEKRFRKSTREVNELNSLLENTLQVIQSIMCTLKKKMKKEGETSQEKLCFRKLKQKLLQNRNTEGVLYCLEALVHFSNPNPKVALEASILLIELLCSSTQEETRKYFTNYPILIQKVLLLIKHTREEIYDEELKQYGLKVGTNIVCELCNGQKREMQDLMRHQEDVFSPVNIVSHMTQLLIFLSNDTPLNIHIITKTLQALIEVCVGNNKNQLEVIYSQVVDGINPLLDPELNQSENRTDTDSLFNMQCKAVELLEILIEDTSNTHRKEVLVIAEGIDLKRLGQFIQTLRDFLTSSTEKSCCTESNKLNFDERHMLEEGMFRTYHILRKFSDELGVDLKKIILDKDGNPINQNLEEYLRNRSYSIEVNYNSILTRIYFPFDSLKELTDDQKAIIQEEIKRDSQIDKAQDLIKWTKSVQKQYEHLNPRAFSMSKANEVFIVTEKLTYLLRGPSIRHLILSILTIFLCLLVLFGLSVPSSTTEGQVNSSTTEDQANNVSRTFIFTASSEDSIAYSIVLVIFGLCHTLMSFWIVFEYFVKNAPYFNFRIKWIQLILYNMRISIQKNDTFNQIITNCVNKWNKEKKFYVSHWFSKPKETTCFDIDVFSSIAPFYLIVFLISSLASLIFSGYFYCLCLPYIFIKISVIRIVLKALIGKAKQLFLVGLFILSIFFIYTVLSFVFMRHFFDPSKNLYCESVGECFVTVIREGLFASFSTIPVEYVGQTQPSFQVYAWRVLIDVIFFVIIVVISLNVIVAILVDRFSELREETEKAQKDSDEVCFVCGIKSDYFRKHDPHKGFTNHYQNEHNMYHYMYYYSYLKSISSNDHNAVQKYVSECMESDSFKFLPIHEAKCSDGNVPAEYIKE